MGFTLPSAGVTPAPSTNRKMARTPFCSQVLFPVSFFSCVIQSEAKNPGPFLCTQREPALDQEAAAFQGQYGAGGEVGFAEEDYGAGYVLWGAHFFCQGATYEAFYFFLGVVFRGDNHA
jgi:hypothetical protein